MTNDIDLHNMMLQLAGDLDLLVTSDEWLNQERIYLAADIDQKVRELEKVMLAKKIKCILQNKNMVAVKQIIKTDNGNIKDVVVKLMSLPDAIDLVEQYDDKMGRANYLHQIYNWETDGYDIESSKALRAN
jgi:hypothetical protein